MSLDAMDWVWEHSQSKGVGRLVMLAIADKALPPNTGSDQLMDCKAYASPTFLQKRANCTREAVTAALTVMYASGELELVPGEKGPYGAAVYRLPKAIGYVRETRAERSARRSGSEIGRLTRPIGAQDQSAHPTNPAHGSQEIGRLSRPGVVGSADQLEPESVGSADHTTSSSPKTTTSAPADPPAPTGTDGGGGGQQERDHLARAEAFLAELEYRGETPGRPQHARLVKYTDAALAAGWTEEQLGKRLRLKGANIDSPVAIYLHRLDPANLPNPPRLRTARAAAPAAPALPDWCKHIDCDEYSRHREHRDVEGFLRRTPCPVCHPNAQRNHAA